MKGHWESVDELRFETIWRIEVEEALASLEVEIIHLANGVRGPFWSRLAGGLVRVGRVGDCDVGFFLVRMIAPWVVDGLARSIGHSIRVELDPQQVVAAAKTREGVAPPEREGTKLHLALASGGKRIEIRDSPSHWLTLWKSLGCFIEIIGPILSDSALRSRHLMRGGQTRLMDR